LTGLVAIFGAANSDLQPFVVGILIALASLGIYNSSIQVAGWKLVDLGSFATDFRDRLISQGRLDQANEKLAARLNLARLLETAADRAQVEGQYDRLSLVQAIPAPDRAHTFQEKALLVASAGWVFARDCLPARYRWNPFHPKV